MKEVEKLTEREGTFNKLLRFMDDGDVVLNSKEEEILARWSLCHKYQLQRKFTEQQLIEKIVYAFKVSEYTARNDIYQAQALYGGSIKTNKKFLLHHHAENIMLFLEKCKLDKSLIHLVPKLMEAYTKAVLALPDELNKETTPPPILNLYVVPGQAVDTPATYEEAVARMEKRQKKKDDEYSEFEELPNG